MRIPLNDLSIGRKLILFGVVTSAIALLVAGAACMLFDILAFRQTMTRNLVMHAEIVGANCTAALSFGDAADATQTLSSLKADEHILAAGIYGSDAKLFASYARDNLAVPALPAKDVADFAKLGGGYLDVLQTIRLDGRVLGRLYIRSDTRQLTARAYQYGLILLAVLCASCAVAFVLASRLQRLISWPIQELAAAARAVSAERNYTVRVSRSGNDELGLLTAAFNEMLEQIQQRDGELASHRDRLEHQVAVRTEELSQRTLELERMNLQLVAAKDAAEQASRAKTNFLANMSHEIRTPMNAITGYADLMLEPGQSPLERQDCLQVIRRNGHHLMDLINDILDISKIEADKMTVECVACDLSSILADVVSLMHPRAAEKRLSFRLVFDGPVPQQIVTDSLRLKQVLVNLVSNAIKFTEAGEVVLTAKYVPASAAMHFDITDTGIGMSEEELLKLFQPFTQADESTTRRFGGTGIGLAISKRLARLLGGDIVACAQPGKGSTFLVVIEARGVEGARTLHDPGEVMLGQATDPNSSPRTEIRLTGRILLAEDGIDSQRLISTYLRRAGMEVVIADNGRIAVELARSQSFDLIIMDMQMPQLDGYGATSELRRRGVSVPVVALTAHALAEDRAKCLRAGCTDYLTKPIDRDVLLHKLSEYLPLAGPETMKERPAPESNIQKASMHAPSAQRDDLTRFIDALHDLLETFRTSPEQVHSHTLARDGISHGGLSSLMVGGTIRSRFSNYPDMNKILLEFVDGLPLQVGGLERLLAGRQLEDLRRALHKLKGAGGGYGFPEITALASEAENLLREGGSVDSVALAVRSLIDLVRRVDGYDCSRERAHWA